MVEVATHPPLRLDVAEDACRLFLGEPDGGCHLRDRDPVVHGPGTGPSRGTGGRSRTPPGFGRASTCTSWAAARISTGISRYRRGRTPRLVEVSDRFEVGRPVPLLHEEALVIFDEVRRPGDRVVEPVCVVVRHRHPGSLLEVRRRDQLEVGGRRHARAPLEAVRVGDGELRHVETVTLEERRQHDLAAPTCAEVGEDHPCRLVLPLVAAERSNSAASIPPRRRASVEESRSGSRSPRTRSGPSARAKRAATTELSIPPDIATTAPRRRRSPNGQSANLGLDPLGLQAAVDPEHVA